MLSGHYSFTYSHPQNWLVLVLMLMLMMLAGAALRQFFVMRHGYKLGRNGNPLAYALLGLVLIAALIVWLRPAPPPAGADGHSDYQKLQGVLARRCYICHGE